MAGIKEKLKSLCVKSLKTVGKTASSIAKSTNFKVTEMNLLSQRQALLSDVASLVYELYQKGEQFPEAVAALLRSLAEKDEELNALRLAHLSGVQQPEEAAAAPEEAPEADQLSMDAPAGEAVSETLADAAADVSADAAGEPDEPDEAENP